MKLHYTGSIRRLQGYGMAFANFESDIELNDEVIGKMNNTAVPDTFIRINHLGEEVNFDVIFYDTPTNINIHQGENIVHKQEQNAFGFEMHFSLLD